MVPKEITYKDLAMYLGTTVGWMYEQHFHKHTNLPQKGVEYFDTLLQTQRDLGRVYGWGIEEDVERVKKKVDTLFQSLLYSEEMWTNGGKVIACERVLKEWGEARLDLAIEHPAGYGIIADIKCKISSKSAKFPISREIDLYGNQAELYPLAWNHEGNTLPIRLMRFIYLMEDKPVQIEDRVVDPVRSRQWLKSYQNITRQIDSLEREDITTVRDELIENPYHFTPWGYACEFHKYCTLGEHPQAGLEEFIQVERKEKG